MINKLSDILLVCDLDNTLLIPGEGLPDCNRASVELFQMLGGRFTVMTGRSPDRIKPSLDGLKLSAPAIACGGAVIYDVENGVSLDQSFLPRQAAEELIERVLEHFPEIGVEIFAEEGHVYVIQANRYTQKHLINERIGCIISPLEYVPDNWAKVVFADDPVTVFNLQRYLELHGKTGGELYFLSTNSTSCEIMPTAVGNAQALKKVCEWEDVPLENTVVIGGYYNDIEIMRAAGHSAAVANAPDEVKLAADEVVSSCNFGGVGEYLYSLIQRYT